MASESRFQGLQDIYGPTASRAKPLGRVVVTVPEEGHRETCAYLESDLQEVLRRSGFLPVDDVHGDALAEIVISGGTPRTEAPRVYVAYHGTKFMVSDNDANLVTMAEKPNLVLSLLVASVATSQVFREAKKDQFDLRSVASVTGDLSDSTSADGQGQSMRLLAPTEPVLWLGCGSVAHAAAYALRSSNLSGVVNHLVDNGVSQEKNIHKYMGLGESAKGGRCLELESRLGICEIDIYGQWKDLLA